MSNYSNDFNDDRIERELKEYTPWISEFKTNPPPDGIAFDIIMKCINNHVDSLNALKTERAKVKELKEAASKSYVVQVNYRYEGFSIAGICTDRKAAEDLRDNLKISDGSSHSGVGIAEFINNKVSEEYKND